MSRTTRTPGLSAFSLPIPPLTSTTPSLSHQTLYQTYGTSIRSTQLSALQTQLSVFRALLHNFALLHSEQIRADAAFRAEFVRMCKAVGVDPASSGGGGESGSKSGGGGWLGLGNLLKGTQGERERERGIEIAVRVVETCRARRGVDGGFTPLGVILEAVRGGRGRGYAVGGEIPDLMELDIYRAIDSLAPLGSGFKVVGFGGGGVMVRSVAKELSEDQGRVVEAVQLLGWVSVGVLRDNFGWEVERAEGVLGDLVNEGVVWVDEQGEGGEREFWGTGGLGWDD